MTTALTTLKAPPAAPPVVRTATAAAPRALPDGLAARAVQLACRRLERAGGRAELGVQLDRYLTRDPQVRAAARAAGLLWGDRLALAGLRLLQAAQADRAARAHVAAQEAAAAQLRAEQEEAARAAAAARQMAALRLLDSLQGLCEALRGARGALEALDSCPVADHVVGSTEMVADRRAQRAQGALVGDRIGAAPAATGSACAAARGARCTGSGPRKLPWCDARWSARCRAPRHEPLLRYLPGGAAAKPSPAMVKARRAYEQDRALRALALAGRRWRLCWARYRDSAVPAGADLGPYLASSRKERRRQRPLYALGYLQQEAMVVAGAPQRLTAAGAAWLAAQVRAGAGAAMASAA